MSFRKGSPRSRSRGQGHKCQGQKFIGQGHGLKVKAIGAVLYPHQLAGDGGCFHCRTKIEGIVCKPSFWLPIENIG